MAQVKVFGLRKELNKNKSKISEIIHSCLVDGLKLPPDKRFYRFFPLNKADFIFPDDRTNKYLIIELSMFEGRSVETKKEVIQLIYKRFHEQLNITGNDIEITIYETPKNNWGIRGLPADELILN